MNKIDLASNKIEFLEDDKIEPFKDFKNLKYMNEDGKILEEPGYNYENYQKEIKEFEEFVNKEINTNPIYMKAIDEFVGMILGFEVKDGELILPKENE